MDLAVKKDLEKLESEMGKTEYAHSGKGFITRRVANVSRCEAYPSLSHNSPI